MASNSVPSVSDLWYNDGNIVLQAESSLFRVFLGVLAAHSPVFNDIQKLPRSQDQEMYDDCPLMVLHDKAEDLANFLRAVYNSGFFEPPPSKTDFDTLAGILRLSTKYEIPYLRQRALRHLDIIAYTPSTLKEYDARGSKQTIGDSLRFRIAELAREMDLPWLLPMVLYTCALSFTGIVTGYVYKGERRWMDRSQQVVCIEATKRLMKWYRTGILGFLYWREVDGCKYPARCNEARLVALEGCAPHTPSDSNPLGSFSDVFEKFIRKAFCKTCYIASRDAHLAAREALWKALPGLFGLSSWKNLKTLRDQALVEP